MDSIHPSREFQVPIQPRARVETEERDTKRETVATRPMLQKRWELISARAKNLESGQKMPVSGLTPIVSLNSGQLLILKPAAAITSCSLGWNGYPLT
jgi:hypothetical protein